MTAGGVSVSKYRCVSKFRILLSSLQYVVVVVVDEAVAVVVKLWGIDKSNQIHRDGGEREAINAAAAAQ